MKKLSHFALATVFFGLGMPAFAQTPGQPTRPQQPSQQADPPDPAPEAGSPMTLTGCLMKGLSSNEYSITDTRSGQKFSFAAPDQLQRYLNQTVQLNGTVMTRGGDKIFRPESVKSLSPSCERSQ